MRDDLFMMLTEGMDESERFRFRQLCDRTLNDGQLRKLLRYAKRNAVREDDIQEVVTFTSPEELEAAYLLKRRRMPQWLRTLTEATWRAYKAAHDSTVRETQVRRLRYLLGIEWTNPPMKVVRETFVARMKEKLYGMDALVEKVADELVAAQHRTDGTTRPILLVGPYGVGKTSFIRAVADSLRCPYQLISMNGLTDPESLKGSSEIYSNGTAGILMSNTLRNGTTRQIIHVDELDKVFVSKRGGRSGHGGSVSDAFIDLFGNGWFTDVFIGSEADFRDSWIFATVNNLELVPPVIQNRCCIVYMDDYSYGEKKHIAKHYVWPALQKEYGQQELAITDDAVTAVVRAHILDNCGVRGVQSAMKDVMIKAVNLLHEGQAPEVVDKAFVDQLIPAEKRRSVEENNAELTLEEMLAPADANAEQLELSTRLMRSIMPAWLRRQVDAAWREYHQGNESEMQLRRLRYLLGIRWTNPPLQVVRAEFVAKMKEKLYGMDKLIEQLADELVAGLHRSEGVARPILLAGPYGVGKTSFIRAVAYALDAAYQMISLNGVRDANFIKGHNATYIKSEPGVLLRNTLVNRTTRQIVHVDELDKVGSSGDKGGVAEALIDLFGGGWFMDNHFGFEMDFRDSWIFATANDLGAVPAVIRNRCRIIQMEDYTCAQKKHIARNYVWRNLQKAFGQEALEISDEALTAVVEAHIDDNCGIRGIEEALEKVMEKAVSLAHEGRGLRCIDKAFVDQLVKPGLRRLVAEEKVVGCTTGLAVAGYVGCVMPIQTAIDSGDENFTVTGLPQEDMLDSCKLAMYLAVKNSGKRGAYDVHIHLGDGAVKKGGPSGGAMLYLALWSALMEIPVSQKICGTGEIDLRGQVKAVGGIPAKLIAAERAGCRIAFIPEENAKDVPELTTLQVIPVRNVKEISEYVLREEEPQLRICS